MARTRKISPDVVSLVLDARKKYPAFGARKLSVILSSGHGLKLSKSAISTILKESGLNAPAGRRCKKPLAEPPEAPAVQEELIQPVLAHPAGEEPALDTAAALLLAADSLVGGISLLSEVLRGEEAGSAVEYAPLLRSLLLSRASGSEPDARIVNGVGSRPFSSLKIAQAVPRLFLDSRCVRFTLRDSRSLCLDSQLHTAWSTLSIPFDFCLPAASVRKRMRAFLEGDDPLCLFMAPGYDVPTKELFFLADGLEEADTSFQKCTVYGAKSDELDIIEPLESRRRKCVFALWPWQFGNYRKVIHIGEFAPFSEPLSGATRYRADIMLELIQPELERAVTFSGQAVKDAPQDKVRLIVLSRNFDSGSSAQDPLLLYLARWPHLEDSFRDFSRQVELFTYNAQTHRLFSADAPEQPSGSWTVESFLGWYLANLDKYLRQHFFPQSFQRLTFNEAQKELYSLPAQAIRKPGHIEIRLKADGALYETLSGACRRLNEQALSLSDPLTPVYFTLQKG